MRKTRVTERGDLTARYPDSTPSRVTVTLASGEAATSEVEFPRGHSRNPVPDQELDEKFRALCAGFGERSLCERALRALWEFDSAQDVSDVLRLLVPESGDAERAPRWPRAEAAL
jgi:2-methylcitrate dehydratase